MVHQHKHATQQRPENSDPTTHALQKISSGLAGPVLYTTVGRYFPLRDYEILPSYSSGHTSGVLSTRNEHDKKSGLQRKGWVDKKETVFTGMLTIKIVLTSLFCQRQFHSLIHSFWNIYSITIFENSFYAGH